MLYSDNNTKWWVLCILYQSLLLTTTKRNTFSFVNLFLLFWGEFMSSLRPYVLNKQASSKQIHQEMNALFLKCSILKCFHLLFGQSKQMETLSNNHSDNTKVPKESIERERFDRHILTNIKNSKFIFLHFGGNALFTCLRVKHSKIS